MTSSQQLFILSCFGYGILTRLKNVDLRRATRRSRDFTRSCGALHEDLTAVGYFAVAGK